MASPPISCTRARNPARPSRPVGASVERRVRRRRSRRADGCRRSRHDADVGGTGVPGGVGEGLLNHATDGNLDLLGKIPGRPSRDTSTRGPGWQPLDGTADRLRTATVATAGRTQLRDQLAQALRRLDNRPTQVRELLARGRIDLTALERAQVTRDRRRSLPPSHVPVRPLTPRRPADARAATRRPARPRRPRHRAGLVPAVRGVRTPRGQELRRAPRWSRWPCRADRFAVVPNRLTSKCCVLDVRDGPRPCRVSALRAAGCASDGTVYGARLDQQRPRRSGGLLVGGWVSRRVATGCGVWGNGQSHRYPVSLVGVGESFRRGQTVAALKELRRGVAA